jgi:hypothetical protein
MYSGTAGTGDALMAIGKDFAGIAKFFEVLVQPGTWIRVGACLAGIALFISGFIILVKADRIPGKIQPVPV